MINFIGRQMIMIRGKIKEKVTIQSMTQITNNVYSVTGYNEHKQITLTMLKDEICDSLI